MAPYEQWWGHWMDRLAHWSARLVPSRVQVTSLMWMRTTMNYQYRHGTAPVRPSFCADGTESENC